MSLFLRSNVGAFRLLGRVERQVSKRTRKRFVALCVIVLMASGSEAMSLGMVIPFLSFFLAPEKIQDFGLLQKIFGYLNVTSQSTALVAIAIAFCMSVVLATVIRLAAIWCQVSFAAAITVELSSRAYTNALDQPYEFYIGKNTSELISGVAKAGSIGSTLVAPLLAVVNSTCFLFAVVAVLMIVNAKITAVAFILFATIYFGIGLYTKDRIHREGVVISREGIVGTKAMQEGFGSIREILLEGSQLYYSSMYENSIRKLRRSNSVIGLLNQCPKFVVEAVGLITIAVIAIAMTKLGSQSSDTIPVLALLALAAQRILPNLQQLYSSFITLRSSLPSTLDALNILEADNQLVCDISDASAVPFEATIRLEGVSYCYPNSQILALDDVNITIHKGERIGIFGKTGSGKSTLVDIIMGLLSPTNGSVYIDGKKIEKNNIRSWQSKISHVPQSIYIADTSVAENIAFMTPKNEINMSDVIAASEKAELHETVGRLRLQYDDHVGERGVKLSGGQRQRLGVARALYKKSNVYIFDEATSALDRETEAKIMKAIYNCDANSTIIVISHRMSALSACDRVLSVDHGKVTWQLQTLRSKQ